MDEMKVNKKEMGNPYKHVLVGKKVVMIDFEKCKYTEKPQNVTQFVDYMTSRKITTILKKRGITLNKKELLEAAKVYKKNQTVNKFKNIIIHMD